MMKMPADEFGQVLRQALGPPPPGTQPVDTVSDVTPRRAADEEAVVHADASDLVGVGPARVFAPVLVGAHRL